MKLSVIIPAYNEIETIAEIISKVRAAPLKITIWSGESHEEQLSMDREIVVVDDGSTDGTRAYLNSLRDDPDTKIIFHEKNQGKGAAVRTGLQHASGEIMLIQDADLEYDPRDYPKLLKPILENTAQVVYGSRFRGGPSKAMFYWHMLGNRFLTFVTNILYNTILTDMETCYKVFSREVSEQLQLTAPGWGFDPEITVQILLRGYRIYEVPISYAGREFEEGKKISWRDGFTVLFTLLKYRITDF